MTDTRALALKAAEVGIMHDDPLAETVYWSPTLYKILGVSAGAAPSSAAYFNLIHPGDRQGLHQAITDAKQSLEDQDVTVEHRVVRPDGAKRWIGMRLHVIALEAGVAQRARTICSITDITDWRSREEEAKHNEARLDGAIFLLTLSQRNARNGKNPNLLNIPMTRCDIADLLGRTIETVSRSFTKLRQQRLIEIIRGSNIQIIDMEGLKEVAGQVSYH